MRSLPSREANLTVRVLIKNSDFGANAEMFGASCKTVEDWCVMCEPVFNDPSAGTYLLALYLEKKLVELC